MSHDRGLRLQNAPPKTCSKCKIEKPADQFWSDKSQASGLASRCIACKSGPEQLEKQRDYQYRRTFGITLERYNELLAAQDGRCAICGNKGKRRRLSIDHDHDCCPGSRSCGKCVRGLLCSLCNQNLLGWICQETKKGKPHAIAVLERAINYLKFGDYAAEGPE